MDSRGSTAIRRQIARPGQCDGIRRQEAAALDPADRRCAQPIGEGPHRPHPVDPRAPSPMSIGRRASSSSRWTGSTSASRAVSSASYDSIVVHWVTDNRRIDSIALRRVACCACHGLERSKLPDLVPSATIIGTLCGPRRADELGLPVGLRRWRQGPATCTPPPWAPAPWPTSTPTSTSARRRGSRATCRSRRPTPLTTWRRSPRPCPAATWWPTSTRRPARVSRSSPRSCCSATTGPALSRAHRRRVDRYFDEVAASVPPRCGRRVVHAVAQRRAFPGRRPHHPRRVPQPVALHLPGRPGAGRLRRRGASTAVGCSGPSNSSWGGDSRLAGVRRGRRQLRGVGPDPRRRHWAPHPPGRRPRARQRARCRVPDVVGPGSPRAWRTSPAMVEVRRTFEPDPAARHSMTSCYGEFVNLYKQTKAHPPAAQPALTTASSCPPRGAGDQMRSKLRASSQSVTTRCARPTPVGPC